MAPRATGELRKLASGYEALIRIEGKKRKGFFLATCPGEDEARVRCEAMAQIAVRLRHAGLSARAIDLLGVAARARSGKPWEAVLVAVDTLCNGTAAEVENRDVPKFATFAKEWTSGALHARHRDHVAAKDSTRDVELLKLYVNPIIGDLRLDEVTLDVAEEVMAGLPADRAPATRRHVAQVVRRVLALAVYPARHIAVSPVPRGWLPKLGKPKARGYLYPDEDAQLMACKAVPLHRRMLWGFMAREGTRGPSEALSFRWRHLDLVRGGVRLDENKTDDPRAWTLDAGVVRALTAWRDRVDGEPDDRVFLDEEGHKLNVDRLAEVFRADLRKAGVDRSELFEDTDVRMQIRAHDLRATFITIALANGRSETWVTDRTGHTTSGQLMNYRRAARMVGELQLGNLVALDVAIPDLAPLPLGLPHAEKKAPGSEGVTPRKYTGGDLNPYAFRRRNLNMDLDIQDSRESSDHAEIGNPTRPEITRDTSVVRQSIGNEVASPDVVEVALAAALEGATKAGEWQTVARLAGELEARRLAREKVVDVAAERRKRGGQ